MGVSCAGDEPRLLGGPSVAPPCVLSWSLLRAGISHLLSCVSPAVFSVLERERVSSAWEPTCAKRALARGPDLLGRCDKLKAGAVRPPGGKGVVCYGWENRTTVYDPSIVVPAYL